MFPIETIAMGKGCEWTPIFMRALFTIARRWKQFNYTSVDKWTHKMWHMHKMEYYSTITRNEIIACSTTWTLEDTK
jgi:hypothetical protein